VATGAESTHVVDGITVRRGIAIAGDNGTLTYLNGDGASRLMVGGLLVNSGMPYATEATLAQPFQAEDAWTTCTLTSQTAFVSVFTATQSFTATTFVFVQAGSMAGASAARLGLYTVNTDSSATLVARNVGTADFNPGWSTGTFNTTGGYPSSYPILAGNVYGVGVFQQAASTPPTLTAKSFQQTLPASPLLHVYKRCIAITGQVDLPTTIANNAARGTFIPWIGVF
jgi:hypothetical protein